LIALLEYFDHVIVEEPCMERGGLYTHKFEIIQIDAEK